MSDNVNKIKRYQRILNFARAVRDAKLSTCNTKCRLGVKFQKMKTSSEIKKKIITGTVNESKLGVKGTWKFERTPAAGVSIFKNLVI